MPSRTSFFTQNFRCYTTELDDPQSPAVPSGHPAKTKKLEKCLQEVIPPHSSVLFMGCDTGDLLDALRPARGVGFEENKALVESARKKHPHLQFHSVEVLETIQWEVFDYIVIAQQWLASTGSGKSLAVLRQAAGSGTRLLVPIAKSGNCLWPPPHREHRVYLEDRKLALLVAAGWDEIGIHRSGTVSNRKGDWVSWLGRFLARLPVIRDFSEWAIWVGRARPHFSNLVEHTCSVILPVRDEAGTVASAISRVPQMGQGTEIIVVAGASSDGTWEELQRFAARSSMTNLRIIKQTGVGKVGALRDGLKYASGQVVMILDADLSVKPERLREFYAAIRNGQGELIIGDRFKFSQEPGAMPGLNRIANRLYAWLISWLTGQTIRDALCGTKVFFRPDGALLLAEGEKDGAWDPFGDFELLLGAGCRHLKIFNLPVTYHRRIYGRTKTRRWRDGWKLICRLSAAV